MPLDVLPRPLLLLTRDLPGTGGVAKVAPEDFEVEELPAYLPAGDGEHLYLWIEKRGLSTAEVAKLLAKATGASERVIGYAGQKDRRAVTRQWMSVHTRSDDVELDHPNVRILKRDRHRNRLRVGHLKGNRFHLTLRGVSDDALQRAREILDVLEAKGLPNYYGRQRFGRDADNALLGATMLGLATHPLQARARKDRHLRRLSLSALQSELFNRCLTSRLHDGTWDVPIEGDVLRKRASGGLFTCEDPETEAPRVASGELDVTGPMPGPKERPAARGAALEREDAVLSEAGVSRDDLARAGGEAEGTRRPYRVPVTNVEIESPEAGVLRLSFALPAGSYATRVLAEVTKSAVDLPSEG